MINYLVVLPLAETVLESYLKRNLSAMVVRLKTRTKLFIPEHRVKSFFGTVREFRSFCYYTLPYTKQSSKLSHEIKKVELKPTTSFRFSASL